MRLVVETVAEVEGVEGMEGVRRGRSAHVVPLVCTSSSIPVLVYWMCCGCGWMEVLGPHVM